MIDMHPPAQQRCQVYGTTSVRCANNGTHWVKFGNGCSCGGVVCADMSRCDRDFYFWECDGHRFGEAA
jgi:hypothetical protein